MMNDWLEGFLEGKDHLTKEEIEIIKSKMKEYPKPFPSTPPVWPANPIPEPLYKFWWSDETRPRFSEDDAITHIQGL